MSLMPIAKVTLTARVNELTLGQVRSKLEEARLDLTDIGLSLLALDPDRIQINVDIKTNRNSFDQKVAMVLFQKFAEFDPNFGSALDRPQPKPTSPPVATIAEASSGIKKNRHRRGWKPFIGR